MDALENQLKEARFLAEEADKKYDEVNKLTDKEKFFIEISLLYYTNSTANDYYYDDEGLHPTSPFTAYREGHCGYSPFAMASDDYDFDFAPCLHDDVEGGDFEQSQEQT